jgi:hypothetical protein
MQTDQIDALRRALTGSASRRRALALLGVGAGLSVVASISEVDAARKKGRHGKGGKGKGGKGKGRKGKGGSAKSASPLRPNPSGGSTEFRVTADANEGLTFSGLLDIEGFELVDRQIIAIGTLIGSLLDNNGDPVEQVQQVVELLVTDIQGTCESLSLQLGPILDALGPILAMSPIPIRLTSERGGDPFSQLLCTIAGSLPVLESGDLGGIVDLLNQIFGTQEPPPPTD